MACVHASLSGGATGRTRDVRCVAAQALTALSPWQVYCQCLCLLAKLFLDHLIRDSITTAEHHRRESVMAIDVLPHTQEAPFGSGLHAELVERMQAMAERMKAMAARPA